MRDPKRLLRAAQIICSAYREGHDVVAVFSAQGDTTDILLQKVQEITQTPDPREVDALLSTGETVSAALGAMAIQSLGVPAVSFTAAQIPIRTDSEHGNATILRIGKRRIRRELERGRVVLVTGFQGVDRKGNITTLGRGGSDLSAVALAASLKADRCQIYTDVDGIYTTDPRICAQARRLDTVSYAHMLALAAQGAQVLHDRSIALAMHKGVVLEVLSCEEGSACTRVVAAQSDIPITGITCRNMGDCVAITAVGSALPDAERTKKICKELHEQGIEPCGIEEAAEQLVIFVDKEVSNRTLCLMHQLLLPGE